LFDGTGKDAKLMVEYVCIVGIALVLAYLCGSLPVALVVGRASAGIDIRQHGSGNTGTTNAVRTLGWLPGLLVFVCDALKGALACLVMRWALSWAGIWILGLAPGWILAEEAPGVLQPSLPLNLLVDLPLALAFIASVLGHMFSPFMGFKGGKGVATTLGALLVVMPPVALCGLGLFLIVLLCSRMVSLSSILGVLSVPVFALVFYKNSPTFIVFALLLALAVVAAHKKNIKRIIRGTEPRLTLGAKKSAQ
jgi:glycerol-3-phosphate acyltransferase PlsY